MNDEFENRLQRKIATLQKGRAPKRNLWPGIEMAVLKEKRQRVPQLAVAASIVVCVLSGWLLLSQHQDQDPSNQTLQIIAQLDALHQQEMSTLRISFLHTQPLTTNWNEQLHDMDQAADAIKTALHRNPQNVTLLKMLSDVYQKEIDLLKSVHNPNLQNPALI